ncbi:MAG: MgtC/SapB family protein [Nanoarchaeota archaeon]
MEISTILLRFIVTFLLALVFGIERQRSHKPIGFGTFIFVSVGSCCLAMGAIRLNTENPIPLLGSIVTGIGFLGAGALIRTTDKIFGFTTAASIWLFAIFGLLIGIGQFFIGIMLYLVAWAVVFIDQYFEEKGAGSYQKKLIIKTNKIMPEKEVRKLFVLHIDKYKPISFDIDKTNKSMTLTYLIESRKRQINKIPDTFYKAEWLETFRIE